MLPPEKIESIERDAGAGLSIGEIAKKHEISWGTAQRYAPKAAKKGKARAGGGQIEA